MRSSILSSIVLHLAIMMMAIVSLPIFNNPDLEIPPIVQVELIEISEKTNVPKVSKKKDKFDPLKIAELIDKSKDTKTVEEDIEDLEYDALDSTPSLDNKLTLSEEDAIRAQFMQCWSIPIGIPFDDTMIVKIKISLNTDGSLLEPPEVLQHERMNKPSEKYFRTLAESALRAVRRCDPIKAPDINRYESWKKIQLNFDPREILRG